MSLLLNESIKVAFGGLLQEGYFRKNDEYAKKFDRYTEILINANSEEANEVVKEILKERIKRDGFRAFDSTLRNVIKIGLGGEEGSLSSEHRPRFEKIYGYYLDLMKECV